MPPRLRAALAGCAWISLVLLAQATTMTLANRRVLYISYNGMLDPLGQSQVIPYLRELSKCNVGFTLLSFERDAAFTGDGPARCEELRRQLAENGIEWHRLRYHQRP